MSRYANRFKEWETITRESQNYDAWTKQINVLMRIVTETVRESESLKSEDKFMQGIAVKNEVEKYLKDNEIQYTIENLGDGPVLCTENVGDELVMEAKSQVIKKLAKMNYKMASSYLDIAVKSTAGAVGNAAGLNVYLNKKRAQVKDEKSKAHYISEIERLIKDMTKVLVKRDTGAWSKPTIKYSPLNMGAIEVDRLLVQGLQKRLEKAKNMQIVKEGLTPNMGLVELADIKKEGLKATFESVYMHEFAEKKTIREILFPEEV